MLDPKNVHPFSLQLHNRAMKVMAHRRCNAHLGIQENVFGGTTKSHKGVHLEITGT